MMKRIALFLCILSAFSMNVVAASKMSPKANKKAEVVVGQARFTILTEKLIRMEWSEDGKFEDNATLAVINRNLPVPKFIKYTNEDGETVIKTDEVILTYSGGMFDANTLKVTFELDGQTVVWYPGKEETGNLLGTVRTLDRCEGAHKISRHQSELETGLLSRDGWAILDESERQIMPETKSDWQTWVANRPSGKRQDLYIFAYGHDYKEALSDFTKIAGRIPLPPKYAFGYWWSRYWAYTDRELLQIASETRERGIPMDVFIVDMDWHQTYKNIKDERKTDEFGQRVGWTGYTWNRELFPDPEGFLRKIHAMGFKTALNLHPASGVRPCEESYRSFVDDYLSRTSVYDGPKDYIYPEEGWTYAGNEKPVGDRYTSAPVPYRMDQEAWASAYFNSVIRPLEKQGVDFWWLDWQQFLTSKYVEGLSNTFWINHCFWTDKANARENERPMIYHRWGGIGSHRYQVGFSGDTADEWAVLSFLPYFTATASNVCYAYWGHDIGGHMQLMPHQTDPEMYTRWLQYGVFTPIFKTHSTSSALLERKIWAYPTHYQYMKEAIVLRYALSPYIYDMARVAYNTGIGICRPLYYEYPEAAEAYSCKEEFLFGDRILATVLCQPAGEDGKTPRQMWFPEGNDWFDMATGVMHHGGENVTLRYAIYENPWFVKAGSVIPMAQEGIQSLQTPSNVLRLLVVPGEGKDSYTHYEDDGISNDYAKSFATTEITKTTKKGEVTLNIAGRKGSYKGMPAGRKIELVFTRGGVPDKVLFNGKPYDGYKMNGKDLVVVLPEMSASKKLEVKVTFR